MEKINHIYSLNHLRKCYSLLPGDNKEEDISILNIFNKTFIENCISDFLAYILNQKANGIGIEPLRKLIQANGGEWKEEFHNAADEISIVR